MPDSQEVQDATPERTRDVMLLEFLREHDADCPVCGYNLRALRRPVCPECRHELMLTVGAARFPIGWLLAAVAPGFFSGIAAFFVLIPIVGRLIVGDGVITWQLVPLDLFGWSSGAFAILLAVKRQRFLALSRARQRAIAIIIWSIHVAALAVVIVLVSIFA